MDTCNRSTNDILFRRRWRIILKITPVGFLGTEGGKEMPASQLMIYLLVYMLPTLFLFGLGGIVLVQNPNRLKNRLVAVLVVLFGLLFFLEFIRHLLPLFINHSFDGA